MKYCGSTISKICKHKILWFWCNISRNLQPWDIVVLVWYLTRSASMRYCASGIISQEIFNQWILWHGCNISGNPQPWHIVDLCNILDLLILVIFLIESDLLQFNLMNQIIQNYQINKINQVNLAHHRTDFGLVLIGTPLKS